MSPTTPRRRAIAIAAVVLVGMFGAACSDDAGDTAGEAPTTLAPEDVKVPVADVVAGLPAVAAGGAP